MFGWMPKSILDKLQNYSHVPIALLVFGITSGYTMHTGKDLTPGYVSSLYAFYGFLGAHFGVSQKWPDQPAPTVDVSVQQNNITQGP